MTTYTEIKITRHGNFESLHKQGAEKYKGAWLSANKATAEHARSRTDVSQPAMKELLSLVTLRILMALDADGWLRKPRP